MIPYAASAPRAAGVPALEADRLRVQYAGNSTPALDGLTARLECGKVAALLGHNGSGKSTFMKAAAGLVPVSGGSLRVFGAEPGACRERVAYLAQRGSVDWEFPVDVRKMVLAGRYVRLGWLKRPGPRDREIAEDAIARMGLRDLADRRIGALSGGQQQRVLLARALAQEADLILIDEALGALDAESRKHFAEALTALRDAGKSAVIATHDLECLQSAHDEEWTLHAGHVHGSGGAPCTG